MAIVVVLFGAIMAITGNLLISGVNLYNQGILEQANDLNITRVFEDILKTLNNASIIRAADLTASNAWLEFQVPTPTESGEYLQVDGTPNWGDGKNLGWKLRLFYQVEGEIQESEAGIDINRDGQKIAVYEFGNIFLLHLNDTNQEQNRVPITTRGWVMRPKSGATPEKIFSRILEDGTEDMDAGTRAKVTILALKKTQSGFVSLKRSMTISPLNIESSH